MQLPIKSSILTLVLSCVVSERLQVFAQKMTPPLVLGVSVFPLDQIADVVVGGRL